VRAVKTPIRGAGTTDNPPANVILSAAKNLLLRRLRGGPTATVNGRFFTPLRFVQNDKYEVLGFVQDDKNEVFDFVQDDKHGVFCFV